MDDADDFFAKLDQTNAELLDDSTGDFFAALGSENPDLLKAEPKVSAVLQKNIKKQQTKKAISQQNQELFSKNTKKTPFAEAKDKKMKPKEITAPMEDRIVDLLVPSMSVLDIVQLVKKMKNAGKSDSDEFSSSSSGTNLPNTPRFICDQCGNTEQNNFITDYARGDTICKGTDGGGCGNVVQDHIVHEGSAYRKFEGEEDKSHHGPAPNNLFSSGHNLRTLISMDGEMAGNLRRAAEFVEINLSQMGKDDRRTRIGYKDQMKQKACRLIDHAAGNLDLHEIVVNRAKHMFAEFRNVREHVHQFEAVVAGCILSSYLDVGQELYSAQNKVKIGPNRQQGIASHMNGGNKSVDDKKLHPFVCNLCKKIFNAKRAVQFHKCEMKGTVDKSTKALNSADLKPMEYTAIDNPIEWIDPEKKKKWFKCPVCNRNYERIDTCKEHMKRHKNQSQKRKNHIASSTMDTTRLTKTRKLASANPSVQVNTHESVMFRGSGRRPWLQKLQAETKFKPEPSIKK